MQNVVTRRREGATHKEDQPPASAASGLAMNENQEQGEPLTTLVKAHPTAKLSGKVKLVVHAIPLDAHEAHVKHLQFSRDGRRLLATSSFDKSAVMFNVGVSVYQWHW